MPRLARGRSQSGIYHVMLRGANKQEIFHDEEDCMRFLETLERYKKERELSVHGWCLMGNHVHLLLQEGKEELAVTMKRIGVSFVWYYNWKYKTTGHLFQDRYKSENIETDEYLLAVIRYIHQNPVKAGMVPRPADWKWSSCQSYYGSDCYPAHLLDSDLILDNFTGERAKFIEYNERVNEDRFLDDIAKVRLTDEEVREEINKVIGECEIVQVKTLPKLKRDEIIARVKEIKGITQRQVSRILGIPLSLVNRA